MKTSHVLPLLSLAACTVLGGTPARVAVDFAKETGPVKCVNGVGQPPMIDALRAAPLFKYLKDAGIPYSRLHDVGGWLGGGLYVDVPNLFPDFDADETDPKNYRFAHTDALLKNLAKNGVEPFFRLGVTIENFVEYGFKPMRACPPKDYAKWARVCEHIIRHYVEGWADGPKMKITYWEIWNEPENHPDAKQNPMWSGTFEDYMALYGVTATHLKKCFPHLKIGGYASCGYYAATPSSKVPKIRSEYFLACSHKFLKAARDNKWPLDFFSFHSYSNPSEAMEQIRFLDKHLDDYGFTADKCERINNEWLPYTGTQGTARQAAGVASYLVGMQNGPCTVACIYDARCGVGNYSPLFNPFTCKPHKAYYAFTAFNELRKRGKAVQTTVEGCADLRVAAAKGPQDAAVMLANDSDKTLSLTCDFAGRKVTACRLTDKERTDAAVAFDGTLPPRSFAVLILVDRGS